MKKVMYTDYKTVLVLEFKDWEEVNEWDKGVSGIKGQIAAITDMSEEEAKPLYEAWIESVMMFRKRWSDGKVPGDIKSAVHSVQDGIGMMKTDWSR